MRVSLLLLSIANLFVLALARTWEDVVNHDKVTTDPYTVTGRREIANGVLFSASPSSMPTTFPSIGPSTASPTAVPSEAPSISMSPTKRPTPTPTKNPTRKPTPEPTQFPTLSPTSSPTPRTSNIQAGYFDYDSRKSANYGPGYAEVQRMNATHTRKKYKNNGWAKNYRVPENFYWNEFDTNGFGPWKGALARRNPSKNRCSKFGRQSPIDIRPNGAVCYEHHQIRNYPGDFGLRNDKIDKQILPNKLRLQWFRRHCSDLANKTCAEPDPSHSDFPNGFGGFADMTHIDFKVPGEHQIYGEKFDAEMQMFHLHKDRGRMPTAAVMIRAVPKGHNERFQEALDQFQKVYDNHKSHCAKKVRSQRRLVTEMHKTLGRYVNSSYHDYSTWADFSTHHDDPRVSERIGTARRLKKWDPYDEALIPTVHFYAYDGSLTEPPCGEWVSWRIFDKPMTVSSNQIQQLKRLIFTHISPRCERTGVQWEQSVARPIQDTAGRPVYYCGKDKFQAECAYFPSACKKA